MKNVKMLTILVLALGLIVFLAKLSDAVPMGTAWTYQGRLMDGDSPADGLYDFEFRLFDDPCTGTQKGSRIGFNNLDVIDGHFTVELDFGSDVFDGSAVWLETTVAKADDSDPCTLRPRIEVTPVPYALQTRGIYVDDVSYIYDTWTAKESNRQWRSVAMSADGTKQTAVDHGPPLIGGQIYVSSDSGNNWTAKESNRHWFSVAMSTDGTKQTAVEAGGQIYIGRVEFSYVCNVGIGTTKPAYKLDVSGDIRSTGSIYGTVDNADKLDGQHGSYYSNWNNLTNVPEGFADGIDNVGTGGDNLGNHIATQNIRLNGHWLSGDGGNEGVFVNNTGNAGIGTTSPETYDPFADNLVVYESGYSGITIASGANSYGSVYFSDGTSGADRYRGFVQYLHGISGERLRFGANGSEIMTLRNGNVSIGTTETSGKLHIKTGSWGAAHLHLENDAGGGYSRILQTLAGDYSLSFRNYAATGTRRAFTFRNAADSILLLIGSGGNVGIGTTSPKGKLDVNGSIYQRGGVLHADYVFEPGYELESIDEHSEFMWDEKHLPAIPKVELDENGREILEVGAHRRGIVEELEKAHIYIEQLHKQNKALEERLVKLEAIVALLNVSQEGGIK